MPADLPYEWLRRIARSTDLVPHVVIQVRAELVTRFTEACVHRPTNRPHVMRHNAAHDPDGDCAKKLAVQDLQGQGTHVATKIAARAKWFGIVGVAPDARVVALEACTIAGYCFANSGETALPYAGYQRL